MNNERKDAFYFPHDSNARYDAKILELRAEYGWEGYGIYWAIIESLRDANIDNYKLPTRTLGGIALSMNLEKTFLIDFIDALVEFDLLQKDEKHFWSDTLISRMEIREEKRQKRADAGRLGARARWGNKDDDDQEEDSIAIAKPLAKNAKERKGKEKKGDNSNHPLILFLDESCPSVSKMKNPLQDEEASKLIERYGEDNVKEVLMSMENFSGLKKYKSTYLTCNNWLKRNVASNPKTAGRKMIY